MNMFDLYIGLLQLYDIILNSSQISNDDLLKELQHQNEHYLMKIIEQNEEIIENQKKIMEILRGGDTND